MAWDDPIYELEYCCDEMNRELEVGNRFDVYVDRIKIKFIDIYLTIEYCPFCGQKINITSKAIYT